MSRMLKKYLFIVQGRRYFGPTKQESLRFIKYWDPERLFPKVFPFATHWEIMGIERGPEWLPERLDLEDKIEYEKVKA